VYVCVSIHVARCLCVNVCVLGGGGVRGGITAGGSAAGAGDVITKLRHMLS
jgi:hypothetical protein